MADRLPLEIIEDILIYLKPSDRLVAGSVCRLWYEASLTLKLWKDITLHLNNSLDEAVQIFKTTRRPIQNIKIKDVDFTSSCDQIIDFWNHLGPGLVSIEIHQCFMTETSLLNMLLPCSSLESLHFHDCRDSFITGKLFSNPLVLNHLKQALPKLRDLCLADNRSYLSDALVDRFMALMPINNLNYLNLAGTSVSFHPGVHKKFYPETFDESGKSKSSELVLTFDCIMGYITNNSVTVKHLDFNQTLINDKACIALSEVKDLKLYSLLLSSCEVTNTGITALCATQSSLTELDVSNCARVTDATLSSICNGLPNLNTLSLTNCRAITDVGLSCLNLLSHLERVNLQGLERISSLGVEHGLLSKPNSTLRRINLSTTRITGETLDHLSRNAPLLTHLDLTSCVKAVTDSSLPGVWKYLKWLRELRLDWCVGLTDMAFIAPNEQGTGLPSSCISNLSGLRLLSIAGCNKITDKTLEQAFGFRELTHLNLNACSMITDIGLITLSEHNRGLEVLVLNYCNKLSDNGLFKSLYRLARLSRLELYGCDKLTEKTLVAVESCQLRYLSYVNVSHCKKMSLEHIDRLQLRVPSIREVCASGLE